MTPCERIRAEAAGLAALRPDDPERTAAWSHARGCPDCARALREGERLHALLSEAEVAPLPAGALERASLAIAAELRREGRRRALAAAAAACGSFLAVAGLARARSQAFADRALAAALWAVALVLAAAARRRPLPAAGAAVAAAAAGAVLLGRPGVLFFPTAGVECLATELASAAAVVGAAWLALRGGTTSPARSAIAAAAAAGALAGDAGLQLACSARAAMPHLLAFHVGGVLLAAGAAGLLWRRPLAVGAEEA